MLNLLFILTGVRLCHCQILTYNMLSKHNIYLTICSCVDVICSTKRSTALNNISSHVIGIDFTSVNLVLM